MTIQTGPLVPADDHLNHQIADTFATVSQTDRAWTEKVAASAYASDGSIQMDFGLGKYTNRGVIDAFGGVSRGNEQWTVRASRALTPDVDSVDIGPLHYDIVEPMKHVRFALDANDIVPVSFEWHFTALVPAVMEDREQHRSLGGTRLEADLVRYHQIGTAHGWVEIDGTRTTFEDTNWISTRDHSWGVRYYVGFPPTDIPPPPDLRDSATNMIWMPAVMERRDGSRYGMHLYYTASSSALMDSAVHLQGGIEHPDGTRISITAVEPKLEYRKDNRRLEGGALIITFRDGTTREIGVRPVSDTGFHLGTGLYFGFDGDVHGVWHGPLHVTGEHIPDCSLPEVARRVHQLRDCVVEVVDPVEGARGWGNAQTMVIGALPELGLTADTSFV